MPRTSRTKRTSLATRTQRTSSATRRSSATQSAAASRAMTPDRYLAALPADRQPIMRQLRAVLLKNLPKGFHECINYGALGYVVPHSLYPPGYHCDPSLPLPFLGIASQKSHIGLYHMGIYADPALFAWWVAQWPLHSTKKLDMGKCCVRFKKAVDVPLKLVGALARKMTPKQWIDMYTAQLRPRRA